MPEFLLHDPERALSFLTRLALVAAASAATLIVPVAAHAQAFPSKPLTIIVPFPPGGGIDLFARVLSEKLPPRIGQSVIVENRPGVGGLAGASAVAKAPPDGHTILVAPNTIAIAPHLLPKGAGGGVDVMKDLVPVVMPASTPMILVVNSDLGVKSVAELVAAAKKTPGLPFGSAGNGSPMQIAGELFKKAAGVDMLHVPYKGVGPSLNDTLSGQIKVLYVSLAGGVSQHIRAGKLIPIAVTEKRRTPLLPDVPTMAELGYKGVEVDAWYGVLAPAGTPAEAIAVLNREINAVIQMPDVRERLAAVGIDVRGGTAEAFGAEMRDDNARYGKIIQEFGIKAD
jgi:tripartite-type tricarboxylate transporter receptor subunit TctC